MENSRFALLSGNVVVIDDSGVQIVGLNGSSLASLDYSEIRAVRSGPDRVTIDRHTGEQVELVAAADVVIGIERAITANIKQDTESVGRFGGLGRMASRLQEKTSEMQASAEQRVEALRTQDAQRYGVDINAGVDYDNASQYQRIQGGLIPGEQLFAVYDMRGGGTGFMGITNRRIITQDEGRWGQKKRLLVSIPYSHIAMVASKDEGGIMRKTSELTLVTSNGQVFEFAFRSGDKAERAYTLVIQHIT
jgi:hypothetical protein